MKIFIILSVFLVILLFLVLIVVGMANIGEVILKIFGPLLNGTKYSKKN